MSTLGEAQGHSEILEKVLVPPQDKVPAQWLHKLSDTSENAQLLLLQQTSPQPQQLNTVKDLFLFTSWSDVKAGGTG